MPKHYGFFSRYGDSANIHSEADTAAFRLSLTGDIGTVRRCMSGSTVCGSVGGAGAAGFATAPARSEHRLSTASLMPCASLPITSQYGRSGSDSGATPPLGTSANKRPANSGVCCTTLSSSMEDIPTFHARRALTAPALLFSTLGANRSTQPSSKMTWL